jgi:hypothetical protein
MSDKISNKINLLYSTSGYMAKYGTDVWTAAIICLAFIVFINYYYFVNVLEVVKADWPNQRCNPLFLPFAGFIQKPTDMSNLEYTASNFNSCLNTILQDVVLIAIQPLYFAMNIIQESVNKLIEAFDQLRKLTANVREQFAIIVGQIYAALTNLVTTMILYVIKIKDSMLKINGILTTAIYTLFGSYMALESLFLVAIDMILFILITLAITTLGLYITTFIIPFGVFAIPLYTASGLLMLAILIPCILFQISLLRIMGLSTPRPPTIPGCFAGATLIELFTESEQQSQYKKIQNIAVGDKLQNGSTVTSVIQFDATEQHVYKLRGTLVTGEHRVFHPTLKWIKVKEHPESVYVPTFNEPFVYCLNTDQKTFTIGTTVFSDWDDIDEEVWADLKTYAVQPGYLPENFKAADIHTHLDSGFQADATVLLANGSTVPVTAVHVNDELFSGERIVGVVKIAAHDLSLYTYTFGGLPPCPAHDEKESVCKTISGSRNIHIDDANLGKINCMQLSGDLIKNHSQQYLYHFFTTTKFVTVNNIRFNDYNSGIDKYLRQFN